VAWDDTTIDSISIVFNVEEPPKWYVAGRALKMLSGDLRSPVVLCKEFPRLLEEIRQKWEEKGE